MLPGAERWYATYTRSRHEKRVATQLQALSVEHYLPLYNSVRRWKDRRIGLQLPLFPGYVFVRMSLRDQLIVLRIPGVVRLIGFDGIPTTIHDDEMEAMRNGLDSKLRAEPHPFLTVGRLVRIKSGPLAGLQGIMRRKKGTCRLVLSLELIQRAIAVEVDAADIEAA